MLMGFAVILRQVGVYAYGYLLFLQVGICAHGYLLFLQVGVYAHGFCCRFETGELCAYGYTPQYLMLFAFWVCYNNFSFTV